jgi:hypothetical protein
MKSAWEKKDAHLSMHKIRCTLINHNSQKRVAQLINVSAIRYPRLGKKKSVAIRHIHKEAMKVEPAWQKRKNVAGE